MEATAFCPHCGGEIIAGSIRCMHCGGDVRQIIVIESTNGSGEGVAQADGIGGWLSNKARLAWDYVNTPPPPRPIVDLSPKSIDERKLILQHAINSYVTRGFLVVSQTDTTAQLVKRKQFSALMAMFLLLCTLGTFLIIYLFIYMAASDTIKYITVDEYGRLSVR